MLNFQTFDECCDYFDKLPTAIETARAAVRGSAFVMGHLIATAIGGTEEGFNEFHILYHIEEDDSHGVAGLFFDATTQAWTALTEL